MSFSSNDRLIAEVGSEKLAQLTGDPDGISINQSRIDQARFHADTMIKAYLYGRYEVPETEPPPLIEKLSLDLTIASLYEMALVNSTIPTVIIYKKISAIKMLNQIYNGEIKIDENIEIAYKTRKVRNTGIRLLSENDLINYLKKEEK